MRRTTMAILMAAALAVAGAAAWLGAPGAWCLAAPADEGDGAGVADGRGAAPGTRPHGRGKPFFRDGDRRRGRFGRPLTESEQAEVLAYLKEHRPEIYEQATSLRQRDPRRYKRLLHMIHGLLRRLKGMPEELREAHETRQEAHVRMWRLAKSLESAEDPVARRMVEKKMREQAELYFDADQVIREYRLAQLAEQIRVLREELAARKKDREAVIEEMIQRTRSAAAKYGDRFPRPGRRPGPGPRE